MIALIFNFIIFLIVLAVLYLIGKLVVEATGLPHGMLILNVLVLLALLLWLLGAITGSFPIYTFPAPHTR
jgi:hypothetical protein